MKKNRLFPCILLGLAPATMSQQLPNTGGQMQRLPVTPAITFPQQVPLRVQGTSSPTQQKTDDVAIPVKSLRFLGVSSLDESELLAQTGFASGSLLTLHQLRVMAQRVTDYYHLRGYFAAQVYLPPQDIHDGIITMSILEGRYGQVSLQNESRALDGSLAYFLQDLSTGEVIAAAPLETSLLLLSDMPGVAVNSTLVPGRTLGTSDLLVKTTAGPRVYGSLDADNAGNRYTGESRVGATLYVNELGGYGDVASLRALTSGSGLQYLRGAYQAQIGRNTIGMAYSDIRYVLGREFQPLGAHGSQQISSVYGSHTLLRTRANNVFLGLNLDHKRFEDVVESVSSLAHKTADVLSLSIKGDVSDASGYINYGLTAVAGQIDLKDATHRNQDATTARTQGNFNKLIYIANRLQKASERLSFYASLNGQWASKNLDVSEKMELGGMYGVRAYPEGEAFADQGYIVSLESRVQIDPALPGQWQLIGFVDSGTVQANHSPWSVGTNRRTLSGAGVGLNWTQARDFSVRAYYAFKLGNEAAQSAPDAHGRFWIQGVKYF